MSPHPNAFTCGPGSVAGVRVLETPRNTKEAV